MAWPWNLGYGSLKVIENGTIESLGTVSYSHSVVYDDDDNNNNKNHICRVRKQRNKHSACKLTPY